MHLDEALAHSFGHLRDLVTRVVDGLDAEVLAWQPDPQSNSIAWLVWHLTRVEDDHIAELAGDEQVWTSAGWPERFGLPPDYADTGYGHSPEQVAQIAPADPGLLAAYHDEVAEQTRRYLGDRQPADFDAVIDRSYDPPVTAGVRLLSVTMDTFQHIGQAAYLRGLAERRGR